MLPTFVIGLREGLEAALIVGIVAAFLRQRDRADLLKLALLGVLAALALCLAGGLALEILSKNLPQRQQEGLETVIGVIAVAMVTYMVVWMRRHSRNLKGMLEGAASDAIAGGSGTALVLMAFLAVLREGFETVVFLLAALNESRNNTSAGAGAVLGIVLACVLGYGIYRGGVRINLSKFFRITGAVLVVVAAGLVVSALHTAHEAGWLNVAQQRTLDLTAITRPGSVQSSLVTGILGIQDRPTLIELIGWLVYLVPLLAYVLWPAGRTVPRRLLTPIAATLSLASLAAAVVAGMSMPGKPPRARPLISQNHTLTVSGVGQLMVSGGSNNEASGQSSPGFPDGTYQAIPINDQQHLGLTTAYYQQRIQAPVEQGLPRSATLDQLAALNGGRLPLGTVVPPAGADTDAGAGAGADANGGVPLSYKNSVVISWWVEPRTGQLIDATWSSIRITSAILAGTPTALGPPVRAQTALAISDSAAAAQRASRALDALDSRARHRTLTILCALLSAIGVLLALAARRQHDRSRASRAATPPDGHADARPAPRVSSGSRLG